LNPARRADAEHVFESALKAVEDAPTDANAWDELERRAEDTDQPEAVADAYLECLARLADEDREALAKRAYSFHERWFGDDVPRMRLVLSRVLEACPSAEWAFDALVTVLTVEGDWKELLDAYDRALSVPLTNERKRQLLVDAAHVAKDFADQPERAIKAVRELGKLSSNEFALGASVARMLEERKQWRALVSLWEAELESEHKPGKNGLRLQIAEIQLERLGAPEAALEQAVCVLSERPGHDEACQMLERVLAADGAPKALRARALSHLRLQHTAANRPEAVVRALEASLRFADAEGASWLRREVAARCTALGQYAAAMDQCAAILRSTPDDVDARFQLRLLAEQAGEHERHASALVAAAEACDDTRIKAELLLAAMTEQRDQLGRNDAALALAERVLALPDVDHQSVRRAGSAISELLRGKGRERERIAALERVARAEDDALERRRLLREVARAWQSLSEPSRALAAWDERLAHDPADLEALAEAVELCAQLGFHDALAIRLRERAKRARLPGQRRRDLLRVAALEARELRALPRAIETLFALHEEFGDDSEILSQLDALLGETARFSELARVLEQSTGRERKLSLDRLCRLGDVYRLELKDEKGAASAYARALSLSPSCERARAGLSALSREKSVAREVCAALKAAYELTDDWQLRIQLLDAELAAGDDALAQAKAMLEVAELQERRAQKPAEALSLVAKALIRAPERVHVERDLLRLAELTGRAREAAQALHCAARAASGSDLQRAADLWAREARLLDGLGDSRGAAEAHRAVLEVRSGAREELTGLIRHAARAGDYATAAKALVEICAVHGAADLPLLGELESAAREANACLVLRDALQSALETATLSPEILSVLALGLASLCLADCDDKAGAERAARRALAYGPAKSRALGMLADVQRATRSAGLVETLLMLAETEEGGVLELVEASEALDEMHADAAVRRTVWLKLHERATALFVREGKAGESARIIVRATEALVPLELEAERFDSALALLESAARLPLRECERARLRKQSAHILAQKGDLAEALLLGLSMLKEDSADLFFVRFLAELATRLSRLPEQLYLRQRELSLVTDKKERMTLRLEVARLTGVLETRDGRLGMLFENLAEEPGHAESLDAACALLTEQRRFRELLAFLAKQAAALVLRGEVRRAGMLWRRAALLAEQKLGEPRKAVEFLEQVLVLGDDPRALDEIIRLCEVVGEPLHTARWLGQKLAQLSGPERPKVALKLARTYLAGGLRKEAVSTLTASFDEGPSDDELNGVLTSLLREDNQKPELARVLGKLAQSSTEPESTVKLAREAARLYHEGNVNPHALVEVADLALSLAPDDAELSSMMADGLSALGRHDEAREVLSHSLSTFGRRRSKERAKVHVQLAEVCRTAGDLESSCAQLELALTMLPGDATIISALAERAGEANDLVRRERALRALYLSVKRGPVQLGKDRVIGVSEVLLALSDVAEQRGEREQASTMRDSALAALRFDDPECARIKHSLRERGAYDVLERIVRVELTRPTSDVIKAELLGELAELLERHEDTRAQGFLHRLEAVHIDPSDPRLHDAALASARLSKKVPAFRAALEKLLERLRRPSDAYARCEVCLRLGTLRAEAADLAGAEALFGDAEATGVRESDVWRAQFELAALRSDGPAQERLLKKLENVEHGDGGERRADVLYRLAEIRLGNEATLHEGITRMRDLLASDLHALRAAKIVLRARAARKDDAELLGLFQDIAQASSELDVVQVAELCVSFADDASLRALLELEVSRASPRLRGTLLIELSRMLAQKPQGEKLVGELLREALELRDGDMEAEALLLAHYHRLDQKDEALTYLRARFSRAYDAQAKDEVTRYALQLHAASDDGESEMLDTLRAALTLCPESAPLREALLARLSAHDHPLERARTIELSLEHAPMRDAANLALEAAQLYRRCSDGEAVTRVLSLGRKHAPRNTAVLQALIAEVRALDLPEVLAELLEAAAHEESGPEQRAAHFREAGKLRQKRLDDIPGAVRAFTLALETRTKDSGLLRELAELLLSEGRTDEAIEHLTRAASHARTPTERAALLHTRGKTLLHQRRFAQAIEVLEQAFQLEPRIVGPDLISALELVQGLDTQKLPGLDARKCVLRLADIRCARGELALAARALDAWLCEHEDDDEVLERVALLYGELERKEELAGVLMRKLVRAEADEAGVLAHKLSALVPELEDAASVRAALELAHAAGGKALDIEAALISTLTFLKDERAIAALLRARATRSSDVEERTSCLARAARHWLKSGAVLETIDALVELRTAAPHELGPTLELADSLIAEERFGEARALLDAVMLPSLKTPAPHRAQLLVRVARVARGQGDDETALQTMQSARDTDKTNRAMLAELAVLAEELNAWDVAERALTSLILLKDEEAMPRSEVLLRRARVARVLSGAKQALLWAKKARDEAPLSQEATELVRALEREG
jgi:tetratricopeptide (TPR) repeat protein